MNVRTLLAFLCTALVLSACRSKTPDGTEVHKLQTKWEEGSFEQHQYEKVLVMALTPRANRVRIENAVAAELSGRGIETLPSHDAWRDPTKLTQANLDAYLQLYQIDALLTVATEEATSDSWRTRASEMEGTDFVELVKEAWTTEETTTDYVVQMTLWNPKGWTPVWSGRSETFKVGETDQDHVARFVMHTLSEQVFPK